MIDARTAYTNMMQAGKQNKSYERDIERVNSQIERLSKEGERCLIPTSDESWCSRYSETREAILEELRGKGFFIEKQCNSYIIRW